MGFCVSRVTALTDETKARLAAALPIEWHAFLSGVTPVMVEDTQAIVIYGESEKDGAVAIVALVSFHPILHVADIHYVRFPDDGDSVDVAAFLAFLVTALKGKGCTYLHLDYIAPRSDVLRSRWEEALRRQRWTKPIAKMVHCHFYGPTFQPPWLDAVDTRALPAAAEIVPFAELPDEELKALKERCSSGTATIKGVGGSGNGDIPHYFSPFFRSGPFEPLNSLALRLHGQIRGWMATQRPRPDQIKYTILFVEPQLRPSSLAFSLLARSINIQRFSAVPWALAEINVIKGEASWLSFMRKRLFPFCSKVEWLCVSDYTI